MPVRKSDFRLRHIIENIETIQEFTKNHSYQQFQDDKRTVLAVITCFSIIGEAARLVPDDDRKRHPEIPWREMIQMRNVLIHAYHRVDLELVWKTIHEDLPSLLPKLRAML